MIVHTCHPQHRHLNTATSTPPPQHRKNGKHLGIAFSDVPTIPLYPTVGLHSLNACCVLNFGQTPFRFDIEGYRQAEMDAMRKDMQR